MPTLTMTDPEARLARDALRCRHMQCAVFIMTDCHRAVLYTGMTEDVSRRIAELHAGKLRSSFARRHRLDRMVYLETMADIHAAVARKRQIKGWVRAKKIALIEAANPDWRDLAADHPYAR